MIRALMEDGLFTIRNFGTTGRDKLGKPIRGVTSTWTGAGRLEQTGSREGEAFVADTFRALMSPDAPLKADSEVLARGDVYTVEGSPSIERIPGFPALTNVAAVLKYVGPVTK